MAKLVYPRIIPADSTADIREHGAVYIYSLGDRFAAVAYKGKSTKSAWRFTFRSEEERAAHIEEFFDGLESSAKRKRARRVEARVPHSVKLGAIIYNMWGYDQTNVDWYEVVRVSPNFVFLQSLAARVIESGYMSGSTMPQLGTASGEVTQHRVRAGWNGEPSIRFRNGAGSVWDGRPMYASWYA